MNSIKRQAYDYVTSAWGGFREKDLENPGKYIYYVPILLDLYICLNDINKHIKDNPDYVLIFFNGNESIPASWTAGVADGSRVEYYGKIPLKP